MLRHAPGRGIVLARSRTWSSTFAESCATSVTLRGRSEQEHCRIPRPGIEPGLAASKTAVRPPHSRGSEDRVPSPGVEPGPRPSEGRVRPSHSKGDEPSRRPDSNRHEPAYKAGAFPFRHVGISRAQGFEPCPRVLEARCSPRSTPLLAQTAPHAPHGGGLAFINVQQRLLVRQKPGPAFDPGAVGRVERLPLGPHRPLRRRMPACSGVRSAFLALQRRRRPRSWSRSTCPPASGG